MKITILKFVALLLIVLGSFASCEDKETGKNSLLEFGLYEETYPEVGRTQINFVDKDRIVITKYVGQEEQYKSEFKYEVDDLILRLESTNGIVTEHYFRTVNKSEFEIGYLYINVPEVSTKMIFKRK